MDDRELVARFFRAGYVDKDYDTVLSCLAPDYLDHSPAGARSAQQAVEILQSVEEMFGTLQVTVEDCFAQDGMVAVRARFSEVHIGPCMGLPATGRRITFEALEHFRVADGQIVESWGYWPDSQIAQLLS